jgi:hypothetical protein
MMIVLGIAGTFLCLANLSFSREELKEMKENLNEALEQLLNQIPEDMSQEEKHLMITRQCTDQRQRGLRLDIS